MSTDRIGAGPGASPGADEKAKVRKIILPDGTLIPEDVFGKPPSDVETYDYTAWFENRARELMKGNGT